MIETALGKLSDERLRESSVEIAECLGRGSVTEPVLLLEPRKRCSTPAASLGGSPHNGNGTNPLDDLELSVFL
jgi:hypothetical protein